MKTVIINGEKVNVFEEHELREKFNLKDNQINLMITYQREFPELLMEHENNKFIIDGEKLWKQLKCPQGRFNMWYTRKIYANFIENVDYTTDAQACAIVNGNGGKTEKVIIKLTVETAKHLAMSTGMDNNSSKEVRNTGRMVRDYFILAEETLRNNEEWNRIREPEKKGYIAMIEEIVKAIEDKNGKLTGKEKSAIRVKEANLLNESLFGYRACEIKDIKGYDDNITRDHFSSTENNALLDLQSLNINLIIAGLNFEQRKQMIEDVCRKRYIHLNMDNQEKIINK